MWHDAIDGLRTMARILDNEYPGHGGRLPQKRQTCTICEGAVMSSENLCDDICAEWCGRPTGQLVAALCGPSDRSPKGIASSFIESSIEILASPGEDFARLIVRDDVERMLVGWLAVDLTAHARSASPPPVRR